MSKNLDDLTNLNAKSVVDLNQLTSEREPINNNETHLNFNSDHCEDKMNTAGQVNPLTLTTAATFQLSTLIAQVCVCSYN